MNRLYLILNSVFSCFCGFIVLLIFFSPQISYAQQAVTKHGENTASGTDYVNEKGEITNYTALTKYGEILLPCSEPITDIRDGNVYQIVRIGNQCWMAENLKYLPSVVDPGTGGFSEYYYVYGYNGTSIVDAKATGNYNTYGVLYNFMAAVKDWLGSVTNPSGIQGICPDGWHMPSNAEWTQLKNYLTANPSYWCDGNAANLAKSLASTIGWTTSSTICHTGNDQTSNNITGFNALPGGRRITSSFELINVRGQFWSSSHISGQWANNYYINNNAASILQNNLDKVNAYSVRCIRDDCDFLTPPTSGTHIISANQIQWLWNTLPHATGYKYNTTNNYTTAIDIGNDTTLTQTGLYCGSNYTLYVWAYSSCSNSATVTLTASTTVCPANPCGGITQFVDSRDSRMYYTVEIGDQCWMKENLRYNNGCASIPWVNSTDVGWCGYYNNDEGTYGSNGLLYQWSAVMAGQSSSSSNPSGVQGICPSGWHLPSIEEWNQLKLYISSHSIYLCSSNPSYHAKSLANNTGWQTHTSTCAIGNNLSLNNQTNFTALPSGIRSTNGVFEYINAHYYSWSSTLSTLAYCAILSYSSSALGTGGAWNQANGMSVRCVKD